MDGYYGILKYNVYTMSKSQGITELEHLLKIAKDDSSWTFFCALSGE